MLVFKSFKVRAEITIIVTRTRSDGGVVFEPRPFAEVLSNLARRILTNILLELSDLLLRWFDERVNHAPYHALVALLFRAGSEPILLGGESLLLICL